MAQPNLPAVTAIVVAAGASRRMGFDKLSYRLPDGRTVLETSCAALAAHPAITQLVLVCGGNRAACEAIAAACPKPCAVVQGGATRADSVRNGLAAATGELVAKSVTDYSKDESGEASVLGTTLYDWSYGESYLPDKELAAEAFNSDEVCALTLVYNPGAADEETQEISIKRGTYVTFVSSTGNLLYADAALTQPIDDTVSIDTNGEEMTVYVVPDVPLN